MFVRSREECPRMVAGLRCPGHPVFFPAAYVIYEGTNFMTTAELVRQNELADALLQKLERIKEMWAECPNEDELADLDQAVGSIAAGLQAVKEVWISRDFPIAEDFDDLDKKLGDVVGSLNEIIEKQAEVVD